MAWIEALSVPDGLDGLDGLDGRDVLARRDREPAYMVMVESDNRDIRHYIL